MPGLICAQTLVRTPAGGHQGVRAFGTVAVQNQHRGCAGTNEARNGIPPEQKASPAAGRHCVLLMSHRLAEGERLTRDSGAARRRSAKAAVYV